MADASDNPLRDVLPLQEAFGRGLKQIRTESDLTLDKVAQQASIYGLKWSTARVVEFERGKIPITVPTLMRLGTALTALTGKPVKLVDLLGWDHWLEMPNDRALIHADALRQAFSGQGIDLRQGDEAEWSRDDATQAHDLVPEVPPNMTVRQLKFMHENAGLADVRAAKKLGMSLDEFLAFAFPVLGIALNEYAHSRAGLFEASPQAVGQVSRFAIAQVSDFAARYKAGDREAVEIMSNLASIWQSDLDWEPLAERTEEARARRVKNAKSAIARTLAQHDQEDFYSPWMDFGLRDLGVDRLAEEGWQSMAGAPDQIFEEMLKGERRTARRIVDLVANSRG